MSDPERDKRIFILINKAFLFYDGFLTISSLILCLIFSNNMCLSFLFLIYQLTLSAQTLQHYFIYKFPLIDINKHHVAYRRTVILICLIDMAYMLMCITFWQKSPYHPIYCYLCIQNGFGSWIGLVLVLHQLFIIGWAITLINSYVTRRYYLLALGGFEVEQRMIQERRRQLQQMMIIQPDTNPYRSSKKDKYYQFEDVAEPEGQNNVCSICLNKKVEDDHYVNAGCGHFFHQICLLQWAQVNQNCPQCRKPFRQVNQTIEQRAEWQQEQQDYEQDVVIDVKIEKDVKQQVNNENKFNDEFFESNSSTMQQNQRAPPID